MMKLARESNTLRLRVGCHVVGKIRLYWGAHVNLAGSIEVPDWESNNPISLSLFLLIKDPGLIAR